MCIRDSCISAECIRMGLRAKDPAGKIICCSMGGLIAIQSTINIAVATGIGPNTGTPLPFISYGLSSLLSLYIGMGIVLNVGLPVSYTHLLYDVENKVTVGERVVTSNISENYLEGIFIGYVSEVVQDSNNLTKNGYLVTPVDFSHLKEVFVITVNKQDLMESTNEE